MRQASRGDESKRPEKSIGHRQSKRLKSALSVMTTFGGTPASKPGATSGQSNSEQASTTDLISEQTTPTGP